MRMNSHLIGLAMMLALKHAEKAPAPTAPRKPTTKNQHKAQRRKEKRRG